MEEGSFPEELMPYVFSSVGMIVVNWTFLENALDAWTAIAYQRFGGSQIEREIPRQFGRKAPFLRKCFTRLPRLKQFEAEALRYLDLSSDLSIVRQCVTHGTLSDFSPSTGRFRFTKIDLTPEKRQHAFQQIEISADDLRKAGADLRDLALNCQNLAARLIKAPVS